MPGVQKNYTRPYIYPVVLPGTPGGFQSASLQVPKGYFFAVHEIRVLSGNNLPAVKIRVNSVAKNLEFIPAGLPAETICSNQKNGSVSAVKKVKIIMADADTVLIDVAGNIAGCKIAVVGDLIKEGRLW